jgi:hypothetical protein
VRLCGLVALLLAGCGLLPASGPAVDPCSAEIVKLEAARDAEILAACRGLIFDACPAVAGIDRQYDALIQTQVRCGE